MKGLAGKTEDTVLTSALITGLATIFLIATCFSTPLGSLGSFEPTSTFRLSSVEESTGTVKHVDVGLWGYCATSELLRPSVNGSPHEVQTSIARCSPLTLGFDLSDVAASTFRIHDFQTVASRSFTMLLAIYPFATLLTIALCLSQILLHCTVRLKNRLGESLRTTNDIFFITAATTLLTFLAIMIQVALIATTGFAVQLARGRDTTMDLEFHLYHTIWYAGFALFCHLINLSIIADWRKERRERVQEALLAQDANFVPTNGILRHEATPTPPYERSNEDKGLTTPHIRSWSGTNIL